MIYLVVVYLTTWGSVHPGPEYMIGNDAVAESQCVQMQHQMDFTGRAPDPYIAQTSYCEYRELEPHK